MRSQPQPRESVNLERKPVPMHHIQRNTFIPYEEHMTGYFNRVIVLGPRDKKFSIENLPRKPKSRSWIATHQDAHQRISKAINRMTQCVKMVTEAIEKENTRDQRKIKIATSAITAYTSILMRPA
jgi:hypothetical protein